MIRVADSTVPAVSGKNLKAAVAVSKQMGIPFTVNVQSPFAARIEGLLIAANAVSYPAKGCTPTHTLTLSMVTIHRVQGLKPAGDGLPSVASRGDLHTITFS